MAGVSWVFNLKAKTIKECGGIKGQRIGPASTDKVSGPVTDEIAMELARQQLAWMQANAPAQVTGGRLLVAEIRRGGIETRDLGSI